MEHFFNEKKIKTKNCIGIWGLIGVVGKPLASQIK
jgi:hypothetical protein